jgi:hypothetical protein
MDTNLDTSDWRLWVMCVIILGCLAFWLAAVYLAARNPGQRTGGSAMKGPVQGGRHIAVGGRSVSPDRYQLATETGVGTETGVADGDAVPVGAVGGAAGQGSGEGPSIPRPARDRDTTVAMPAQRAESPADKAQPTGRP